MRKLFALKIDRKTKMHILKRFLKVIPIDLMVNTIAKNIAEFNYWYYEGFEEEEFYFNY